MARYDLVIRNATIVDGTRAPRFQADVAIQKGRIQKIGPVGKEDSDRVIDASGKILAPGFIDAHTHDDRLMLSAPDMAPKVSQGVTTVVAGNCGISLAPAPRGMPKPVTPPLDLLDDEGSWFRFPTFKHYVEELRNKPAATNCALLVGHTMLRVQTMDDLEKPASKSEIAKMQKLVDEALDAGAIGVSTGLYYEPARAATTEEVIEVCRPLSARNALYCTHMRNEADGRGRFARGDLPHRPRARHPGGHVAPQGARDAEPRPLRRDAADHREGDALAEGRPRLLSLLRLVDHPLLEPRRHRLEGAGHLVQDRIPSSQGWT